MKQIWTITKRELASFFDSLMAYIMLIVFLAFSGLLTWVIGSDIFMVGQASLQVFFGIAYWTLFIFTPALTMGLLAEEKRSGTIELLTTKPVTDMQVIIGKFLSTLLLIVIALVLTVPYYITVANIGNIDHGAVISGYLGLIFMSAAYISIGILCSSITTNQIVAFLLTLVIGIFFHLVFNMLANFFTGTIGNIMSYLSIMTHFESISRGVIDTRDIIYFCSIIFIGIIATETNLAKRNIVD